MSHATFSRCGWWLKKCQTLNFFFTNLQNYELTPKRHRTLKEYSLERFEPDRVQVLLGRILAGRPEVMQVDVRRGVTVVIAIVLQEERLDERRRSRRGTRRRRTQTDVAGFYRLILGVDRQLVSDGATAQRRRYDSGHRHPGWMRPLGGSTHWAQPSIYGQKIVFQV